MQPTATPPSPELFFETINAYQRTAALKTAIELNLFTAIAEGASTADEVARHCGASLRGARILCDYLTIIGFLTKDGARYQLTSSTALFLDRHSPAFLGGTVEFLSTPAMVRNFDDLSTIVRNGALDETRSSVAPDNPVWVQFARAMRPMMAPAAEAIADTLGVASIRPLKVLDIAAGHGAFGLAIADRNPEAEIVAVDWEQVLHVASENAAGAGVGGRFRTRPGDAFSVDYGTGYQLALVTNFLHHFDEPTCITLLQKVGASLASGGRVAVLEFVPNEDRVSPSMAAGFSMTMLGTTAHGDAYTFEQMKTMLEAAGLSDVARLALPMPETLVTARKA
jgi:O-methyltransferase domain/Dimerisation domain